MLRSVASRLAPLPNVIGFGSLNEQTVRNYRFTPFGPLATGYVQINESEQTLWKDGYGCPWQREGVWDFKGGKPVLLKPHYFSGFDHRDSQEHPGARCSGNGAFSAPSNGRSGTRS
jgi:hypothetical protein